ncbi:NAD-P-binding protein [Armillaria novae-zelandiae]|uniref:NAD-P-binding protein n=1 Tax=Armillaria novae-zelandiae TaxID=153914 RepID=A0AA39PL74_9AGAR|nr:NAD-P-binding protein [Armillaria novae-zelandiae]
MSPRNTVLITGCSTGIGNALAREFHKQGLVVFATGRNETALSELSNSGIQTFPLDVTNEEQIIRIRDQVAEITGGKLDILVNNAGQTFLSAAADLDMKRVQDLYDVNVFGAMRMVKAFAPLLIASGDACILQVGSVAGVTPYPFGSTYSSSKAALHAYGNTLRIELSPFNIKVVNLCTGSVKSDIIETKLNPLPSGSLYKSIESIVLGKRKEVSQGGAMSSEDYAKNVVLEALKANPRAWVWEGSKSWFVWMVDTFLPRTAFDNMMKRWYGMDHIRSGLQT